MTLADVAWPVRTDRLLLRPAQARDAETTWAYRRLPAVAQWIPMLPEDLAAHRAWFTQPERLAATVIVQLTGPVAGSDPAVERGVGAGPVIGDLKLDVTDAWAQREILGAASSVHAEIGWAFDPAYQGRGLATEAVAELVRLAFDELGLRRVMAYCFAANEASWRLMERVGMRREAYHVADGLHRSGSWEDGMVYALLADEWRERSPRA